MSYCVYMHTCPNGKRYVGVTMNRASRRWGNGGGYKRQVFWNAIDKYKWHNIRHEILLTGLSKKEAEYWERFFIAMFRADNSRFGYNRESGGDAGKRRSAETVAKMSKLNKGEKNPMYGRHHTKEAREKIGLASSARERTPETRAKISASNMGRKGTFEGKHHSEESKEKIRNALSGHEVSDETRRKIGESCSKAVINLDTGEVFESLTAAGKRYGTTKSKIGDCLKGRAKTCAGYRWGYAIDYENTTIPRRDCNPKTFSELLREYAPSVVNLDTGEVFQSASAAAEAVGVSEAAISNCVRGKSKTSAGYHWAYANLN